MDISCCEADLVAVLKQGDPMGTRERWFVDRGGKSVIDTKGVPGTLLVLLLLKMHIFRLLCLRMLFLPV